MFTVMIMLMAISPLLAFLLFIAIVARIAWEHFTHHNDPDEIPKP